MTDPNGYERPAIAGSGVIACGVAACATRLGEVRMLARSDSSASRAEEAAGDLCGKLDGGDTSRLETTTDAGDLAGCDLIVEAIIEDPAEKGKLLAELVELCFPDTVRAETRQRVRAWSEAIGKTPIEVPDQSGFVVNRLLFPYLFDAVRLLESTGMSAEDVDASMKLGANHPMGPLALLDMVGLDVAIAIGEAMYAETGLQSHEPPPRLRSLAESGKLGKKSGEGFHTYNQEAPR